MENSNLNYDDSLSLYIISFLRNDIKDGCCYTAQRCNIKDASIINYVILGHKDNPFDIDNKTLEQELKSQNWDTDKLLERVQDLTEKFNTMKNTIFVIHCRRGRDRTGEFVSAYRMIIKKHDFDTVVKSNEEIGKVKEQYLKMQKWLCLFLEKVLGYSNIGCYDFR
ncbi:hypothetical protein PMALA_013290 [Plasmodium malariae]|nr:hypothetical protein PMALA_013290 [Plasmodium malariae]